MTNEDRIGILAQALANIERPADAELEARPILIGLMPRATRGPHGGVRSGAKPFVSDALNLSPR